MNNRQKLSVENAYHEHTDFPRYLSQKKRSNYLYPSLRRQILL